MEFEWTLVEYGAVFSLQIGSLLILELVFRYRFCFCGSLSICLSAGTVAHLLCEKKMKEMIIKRTQPGTKY